MALHQIVLVGRRMDTALLGVKEFHPDVVHMFFTPSTRNVFRPFVKMLESDTEFVEHPIDPYDVSGVQDCCRKIRQSLGKDDTLIYNLTEGTKIAAFAALLIAYEYSDEAVYYSQEGEVITLPSFERRPNSARISNEEFVPLFGNELSSFSLAEDILPVDVASAWNVKSFIEKNQKTYQRIQRQFRSEFGGRIENLSEYFKVDREHNMTICTKDGQVLITDRGKIVFRDDNPYTTMLFFTGRWWEVIVSDMVLKWDLSRHARKSDSQVWRSVEFRGAKAGRTKNELDILVNDRRRLVMIECKSGYIAQENIYKIDSVRETYGGDHSLGILCSYYPLEEDLKIKCRDLGVQYFCPEKDSERINYIKNLPPWLDTVIKNINQ